MRPCVSKNGKDVIFTNNMNGKMDIYKMDIRGGNLVRLTNNNTINDYPVWSNDGKKIDSIKNDKDRAAAHAAFLRTKDQMKQKGVKYTQADFMASY